MVVQHLLDTKLCKKREKERMIKKEKVWRVEDKIECYIYIINVGGERRSLKSVDSNWRGVFTPKKKGERFSLKKYSCTSKCQPHCRRGRQWVWHSIGSCANCFVLLSLCAPCRHHHINFPTNWGYFHWVVDPGDAFLYDASILQYWRSNTGMVCGKCYHTPPLSLSQVDLLDH